ncbi:MAG: UDP-N-acetylglucosamine 1-carboxyvinyltransferase [Candidatus Omnitrophica bacterium]|nr:UDP-N-acetylglucosamine 1-carboxyvinyltransferase [Candidatus Omnitrophota bacterium]
MDKLIVEGGVKLKGTVHISGAKNACLPIIAASLLTSEETTITNVPNLKDISTMVKIISSLGRNCVTKDGEVTILQGEATNRVATYDLVSTMRASIAVLGPLLAKYGEAKVSFPGGCVIGPRPIDLHLKGLKELGADLSIKEGYIVAKAKKLIGKKIYLGGHFGSSVLATINTLMAAVLAEGSTIIENGACEPEVVDLANFIKKMGADIEGVGTPTLRIRGVKKLNGVKHKVIADRIEAGTYMAAAAITGGTVTLTGADIDHNIALIDKFRSLGVNVTEDGDNVTVSPGKGRIKAFDLTTHTYPGFPTDLQAQMMSVAAVSDGISVITEKIYPERFIHISELNRMGADIILEGPTAIVRGVKKLSGAPVMASDLRASAALVIAGLVASGETEISRIYHLDRGYEKLEQKLSSLGAKIKRIKE